MPEPMAENKLYYGDNLGILRDYVRPESVDLVYLDPPFNSAQDYNVLFKEHDGAKSSAQIMAFEDTWKWGIEAAAAFEGVVESGGPAALVLRAFRTFLGDSDMLAYLAMMAPRLAELHRVLKPTGSLYLHCDPTASHYLKMLLDATFGPANFCADIRWQRTSAHANASLNYAWISDQLLYYTKGESWTWNQQFQAFSTEYIESHYGQRDSDGRHFTTRDLTASMSRASSGQLYDWRGVRPVASRCWSFTKDKMEQFESDGLLVYGKSGVPRLKLYLDAGKGTPVSDIWDDIPPINSQAAERLGYPTQKPEALLERIILASSNQGDVVLDPFCGCGTAVAVAHRLDRQWVGIDITHLAIGLIKHRLADAFGHDVRAEYDVIGEPASVTGAEQLAKDDPFQFQAWALGLVDARVASSAKKGADKGIDGRLYFHDEKAGKSKSIVLSVKAGGVTVSQIRDLRGVMEREEAEIGALISMEAPTGPMKKEAASAGFYASPWTGEKYPRIQLLTIEELFGGARLEYPGRHLNVTMRRAPRARRSSPTPGTLPFAEHVAEDSPEYEK